MTHAHKHTHTQRVHTQSSQELQREAMVAHAANAKFETELKERMSQLGASRDEEVRLRGLLQQLQVCVCVCLRSYLCIEDALKSTACFTLPMRFNVLHNFARP